MNQLKEQRARTKITKKIQTSSRFVQKKPKTWNRTLPTGVSIESDRHIESTEHLLWKCQALFYKSHKFFEGMKLMPFDIKELEGSSTLLSQRVLLYHKDGQWMKAQETKLHREDSLEY